MKYHKRYIAWGQETVGITSPETIGVYLNRHEAAEALQIHAARYRHIQRLWIEEVKQTGIIPLEITQ